NHQLTLGRRIDRIAAVAGHEDEMLFVGALRVGHIVEIELIREWTVGQTQEADGTVADGLPVRTEYRGAALNGVVGGHRLLVGFDDAFELARGAEWGNGAEAIERPPTGQP